MSQSQKGAEMPTIKRFEDVEPWQRARELTKVIYQLTAKGQWAKDFGLRDQIRRAAVSAMSNVAEGFERRGDAEFVRFLSMAKASAGEVRSQLYAGLDLGYVDDAEFAGAYALAERTSSMIAGFISYLKDRQRTANP
jgi:four helix bundle protein